MVRSVMGATGGSGVQPRQQLVMLERRRGTI